MKHFIRMMLLILISNQLQAQEERIIFEAPMMYPEGVAYDKGTNLFYVSSVKTGTIGTVTPQGQYKILYQDNMLKSSFGMKADARNNRLLVCIGDPNYSKYSTPATFKKMARIISIDLTSGLKKADINLESLYPGKHFANDLAVDDKGNIYITDSFSPVIYKIDAGNKPSVYAKSELFKSEDVGLNGIVYHPGGFLLVAHNTDGILLKVDAKDPSKINKVKMKTFFPGADGLLLDEANNLVLVQNKGVNKIFQISSNDNWITAEVKAATAAADRYQQPTTATLQNGKVWVLNSKMDELADSSKTPSKEFSLQAAKFQPVQ